MGALLLPSESGAALSRDRAAFLQAVWPVIAAANARAPSHSRLLPEMVEILPPGTAVPVATKMSILRPACYRQFAAVIDGVYARFEGGGAGPKRAISDRAEMEAYLLELLGRVMGERARGVDKDTDLFAHGVDSLQATRVRNTAQKELALRGTLGQNVVYEHPSVAKLARHILSVASANGEQSNGVSNGSASAHDEMRAMAAKWALRVVPPVEGTAPVPAASVVLVTGATGSLGAHAVASLLRSPGVRVICLSRARSHADSKARLAASFAARRLAPDWARIESYAADLASPTLGLAEDELARVRDSVTGVLHLAWPVNFAAALGSFEPSVAGAVHLLNLAQASPHERKPGFFFASSVGAVQASEAENIQERFSDRPEEAGGTGYARSKWVVEAVLGQTRGTVLRIGQLVGDSTHGVWNETEAWPLMFRSVATVGALPDLEERVAWLPVDLAAEAIAEAALGPTSISSPSSAPPPAGEAEAADPTKSERGVLHILNRHTAPFRSILDGLRAAGVQFDTVPRREWLDRLAASDADVARNPTRKLLPFYEARIGGAEEKRHPSFDTTRAEERCQVMRGLGPVDAELVRKWVAVWRESGFLPEPVRNGH